MPVHRYLNGDVGDAGGKGEELWQPIKTSERVDVGHADVTQGEQPQARKFAPNVHMWDEEVHYRGV